MREYTRDEILQALKACSSEFEPDCERCPLDSEKEYDSATYVNCVDTLLKAAAKILDSENPPKARWEHHPAYKDYRVCSLCRGFMLHESALKTRKWDYCPACGASMRGNDYQEVENGEESSQEAQQHAQNTKGEQG